MEDKIDYEWRPLAGENPGLCGASAHEFGEVCYVIGGWSSFESEIYIRVRAFDVQRKCWKSVVVNSNG